MAAPLSSREYDALPPSHLPAADHAEAVASPITW